MPVSATEAAQHYSQRHTEALELIRSFETLDTRVDAALATVRDQLDQALAALAQAYLPTLDAAGLAEAERLTGFRGFSRRDPIKAMERERSMLQKTVARILADERYRRREYLVGPVGELTRERAEAASLLEPWESECGRFEQQEGFLELLAVKYDTPQFAERFWEASYWKHWATGDRICSALELDDFGDDVLPAYTKVAEERERWRAEVAKVDARIDEVHELVRQHDEALARIPRLPELTLQGCHQVLAKHLEHADPGLLDGWLAADGQENRPVRIALRRVAGLVAKRGFLEELRGQGISGTLQDLRTRAAKYSRKSQKYMRPKMRGMAIPDAHLDQKFGTRVGKLEHRIERQEMLLDRLLAYDAYDRFELSNDPELWWVEMTGKRPGRLTPRLRRWYDQHSSPSVAHDPAVQAAAVARAAADRELDALDYLS